MNTIIENIVNEKVKIVWCKQTGEFWKAFAESYFTKDTESCERKEFITVLAFYPDLIRVLLERAKTLIPQPNVEITFLSTLLPRHYWNFPLSIKEIGTNDTDFYSMQIKYIDDYRNEIIKTLQSHSQYFSLKRILILTAEQGGSNLFGTHLFDYRKLDEDKTAKIPVNTVKWQCLLETIHNDKSKKKKRYINDNLVHLTSTVLESLYDRKANPTDKSENMQVLYDKIKNKKLYTFNKMSESVKTVYDYYIQDLHSLKDSSYEAKYIVFDKNVNEKQEYRKKEGLWFSQIQNEFNKISLDSALIKFGDEEFILDVYMDIIQNIISVNVVDSKDTEKFKKMKNSFDNIEELAKPLLVKSKTTKGRKESNKSNLVHNTSL